MEFFKTTLGKIIGVLIAVFLVFLSIHSVIDSWKTYRDQRELYKNTIFVSGEGKVQARPDIAQINLSVISRGTTVAAVSKDNTTKMNAVITALKGMGVDEKDIKSTTYYLEPQYDYDSGISPPRILGYSLEQGIDLKIRNIDKAGDIIQKATDTGANRTGQINFTIDDPETLRTQARELAFNKAREKAETLARQAGVKLGKIVSFSDDSGSYLPYPDPYYRDYGVSATMDSSLPKMGGGSAVENQIPSPVLQSGSQEVIANVSVTYEIY